MSVQLSRVVTHTPVVELNERSAHGGGGREHTFVSPVPHIALPAFPLEGEELLEGLQVIDMPTFRSLGGVVILCLWLMLLVSVLFICLGRSDFNLVLYLLGYHVWCVQSKLQTVAIPVPEGFYPRTRQLRVVTKQTAADVTWFTCFLAASLLVDGSWIALAASSWDRAGEREPLTQRRLDMTHFVHRIATAGSSFNMGLKVVVLLLSCVWLVQQKRHQSKLMLHTAALMAVGGRASQAGTTDYGG